MQEQFKLFTVLIASINRNIRRIKTEIMAEHKLKCPHVSTLYYLYAYEKLTLKELCELCREDKGAISRSVKSLSEDGLVDTNFINKKYKNKLSLTEKGKIIGKDIVSKIDIAVLKATHNLGKEEKDNVYRGLSILNTNLENFSITEK